MAYQDLGPRTKAGESDALYEINPFLLGTGWDVVFNPVDWNTGLNRVEVYQISLDGPIGSSVWMLRNNKPWNFVSQGWLNSDDPFQPLPLGQTDTVQFCWNVAATSPPYDRFSNIQPTVTCWIRQEIPALGL